jgi:hypothetical protein
MLPMSTAAHKPQESIGELIERIDVTKIMSKEDATRILQHCTNSNFHDQYTYFVRQAIAVKLAGM